MIRMDDSVHLLRRVERPGPVDDALIAALAAASELDEGLPEETFADPDTHLAALDDRLAEDQLLAGRDTGLHDRLVVRELGAAR